MEKLFGNLTGRHQQLFAVLLDAAVLPLALWVALGLRLGVWTVEVGLLWPAFGAALVSVPALAVLGFYRQKAGYMGGRAIWTVAKGATVGAAMIAVVAYMVPLAGFPRSVPFIFWLLCVFYIVGSRLVVRGWLLLDEGEGQAGARAVEIKHLLGRREVDPLPHLLKASVAGRTVMVTGAGGSIGSELCRQIVRLGPSRLVLLDHSEYALFQIAREIEQMRAAENLNVALVSRLGSVANRAFIHRCIDAEQIETLYHAAAYKHVGIVENNLIQGLKNNAFGTLYAAEGALAAGVRDFILISTDKAVRTTSAMGASKRLAEMILQALQETSKATCFSIVRFGNVLGSSGSVVPLFLEQIENGGPVTVTHPDVTRYFMTIQEAAQLVLQAASLGRGGDVFLLDMGQPVKIMELAARMALIKGHRLRTELDPDGDIGIEFIGLRPGEKLHEELLVGEDVTGTEHRRIMRAEEKFIPWGELRLRLQTLEQACDRYDFEAIKAFMEGLVQGSDLESQLGGLVAKAPVLRLS